MDSPQRAKKAEILSQATDILGKRPQIRLGVSGDENERFDADEISSGARRLRRKVQRTNALFPEFHDLPLLSLNGDQEFVTRFEHRQHKQQVVAQSQGGGKGTTGNQPQQFATRAMTRSRSQQRMLKTPPDSQLGTARKGYQSRAGPSPTSNHETGGDTAYANLGYDEIPVNSKTPAARYYASPSNTSELVDGPVEVRPSLRPTLKHDYKKDPPNQLYTSQHSGKHWTHPSKEWEKLKLDINRLYGGSHDRTTSDWTNVSSYSFSEKSSKKESYEGTSAKANDTRHDFPPPSSRRAYTPAAQVSPALMGGMPPGANPNTHTLQHLNLAAQQQMLQLQIQQQRQLRQLMEQQDAVQANKQDGLPIEMAKSSQLNPQEHYPQAQANLAQQLALQHHQQEQQEQQRQGRQPLAQGSDILIDTDHLFMDTDQMFDDAEEMFEDADNWVQTLSWDNKESTDKRVDGTRRLKADLRDPSANFSSIGHYTISQDNTEGEEARKSLLLAKFGKRCTRNRDAEELEKQKALRRDRFSF